MSRELSKWLSLSSFWMWAQGSFVHIILSFRCIFEYANMIDCSCAKLLLQLSLQLQWTCVNWSKWSWWSWALFFNESWNLWRVFAYLEKRTLCFRWLYSTKKCRKSQWMWARSSGWARFRFQVWWLCELSWWETLPLFPFWSNWENWYK